MTIRYTTYYSSVERVVYELSGNVLRDAVLQYLIDGGYMKNDKLGKLEIEWTMDEYENAIVEVTKIFEQQTEPITEEVIE